ncbi:MAG TPA: hypothetical protein VHE81_17435 [Lacipirellulaceae bacterium]|nr:hypothetical protein [Lacipirellulaceae bacterium]
MKITEEQIQEAAENLGRSETGRVAMSDLLKFLERRGLALDGSNQKAILTILVGAWSGKGQTSRDEIRRILEPDRG